MSGPAPVVSEVRSGSGLRDQNRCDGAFVGSEPIGNVVMMEDHDGAYYAWKRAGMRGRILLHLDAHIDWNWIADRDPLEILQAQSLKEIGPMLQERCLWNLSERQSKELVHIGNYIYPALREGIVSEFYWIVPDPVMQHPRGHRDIVRMFQGMMKVNPRGFRNIGLHNRRIVAEVDGKRLTACSLSDLPRIQEPVLLDIDTDFLTAGSPESVDGGRLSHDLWKQLPWIWPDELVGRLRALGIRTDFVTIAYSVKGGFTPLGYKYLGDELALRLKRPTLPEGHHELMRHKRRAARYRCHNELDQAIAEYEQALEFAREDASSHFNLAYLYDRKGLCDRAAARYRQAVALDPSYGTAYNNFGSLYHSLGLHEKAQEEYQRILRWDSQNADAHCGLAEILTQKERWDEAIHEYRRAMELRPGHARAHRGLGRTHAKRGLWDEAIMQLKSAIALQPDDGSAHFWLGEAYSRQMRWDEAIDAYRGALRCGIRNVAIHMRLGRLYLRKSMFYKALKQYRKGLRLWGCFALAYLVGLSKTLRERLSRGFGSVQIRRPAL